MSKSEPEDFSRRSFIGIGAAVVAGMAVGCGSDKGNNGTPSGTGGAGMGGSGADTGGASAAPNGGAGTGGASAATGGTSAANGGAPTGGTSATAANTAGNSAATGGAGTGGTAAGAGGAATGGAPAAGGKTQTGGASTASSGGAATGGTKANSGGAATGGAATGGASSTGALPLVSLVRGTDWVQATQDAIALVGGLPDLTGKKVMLRPNVISSHADYTTSKDVIRGVIRAVKAKGATDITVAEDGWNTGGDTIGAMRTLGIVDVCTAEGATPMDLAKQSYTTRTNSNASAYPNGIDFSDPVYNADYVIAIPVCKTHSMSCGFTMALKLWYGNTKNGRSHGNTWTAPAELHLFRKADFTVLDATKTTISDGPDSGTVIQSKIVVASKDAIAADVTGLFIEKYSGSEIIGDRSEAWTLNVIKRALALKFPGWLTAAQQFPYAQQGVTEAATIMGY